MSAAPDAGFWSSWEPALRRFAAATGLVVAAYDGEGQRRLGPFAGSRLGELLSALVLFAPDPAARAGERALLDRVAAAGAGLCHEQLRVRGLALPVPGRGSGVILFGWVQADFASTLGCERLARAAGLPGGALWRAAREEAPVSERRMEGYGAQLAALVESGTALRQTVERLEDSERSRDLLVALVSHDLRTPLSAISLRVQILLQGGLDNPGKVRATLEAMRRNVEEGARLTEDLLAAALTKTGHFDLHKAPADLAQILAAAVEAIAPAAQARQVVLRLLFEGEQVMPLWADAARLRQALWNVIANGVKFTPPQGQVDVRAQVRGDHYVVDVEDEGPGVPAELAARLFEPFATSKQHNAHGIGLGLAIAQQIVRLHQGHIEVGTAPRRRGARFSLHLPRGPAP